jgi:hypothetical protein
VRTFFRALQRASVWWERRLARATWKRRSSAASGWCFCAALHPVRLLSVRLRRPLLTAMSLSGET